jgi:hypothetical protein
VRLSAGGTTLSEITLKDTPDQQDFTIKAHGVSEIRLTIVKVYAGQKGTAASISGISFFHKQ